MRSAEHGRSPNHVRSLPHTLPASPTAYNEHRINPAHLWKQPRAAASFTEGLGMTGTLRYHEGRQGAALPQPGPAEGHRDPRPSPRLSAGHSPGVCEPRSRAPRARIALGPGPGHRRHRGVRRRGCGACAAPRAGPQRPPSAALPSVPAGTHRGAGAGGGAGGRRALHRDQSHRGAAGPPRPAVRRGPHSMAGTGEGSGAEVARRRRPQGAAAAAAPRAPAASRRLRRGGAGPAGHNEAPARTRRLSARARRRPLAAVPR